MRTGLPSVRRAVGALAVLIALLAHRPAARAGTCGDACHTVCEAGCDYPSPSACANGAGDGDTCLVQGGHYHETVELDISGGVFTQDLRFVCDDPATAPCRIDGDGVRAYGFRSFDGWEIDGFEIFNTSDHGITGVSGRFAIAVRDCHIHDVGGAGVSGVDDSGVIEGNRIERVFGSGIRCLGDDVIVINNLVRDAGLDSGQSGIACATPGTLVLHNTVDVRRGIAPPYAIYADTARYNVALGGNTALRAVSESVENLAFDWTSAAWSGVAGGVTDLVGDPLLFHRYDHRPAAGSPLIGAATSSTELSDLGGDPRDALPDIGAYEWADGDEAAPSPWRVDEVAVATTTEAAPAMVRVPGVGPSILYIDQVDDALRHAFRVEDGNWTSETITAATILPDAQSLDVFRVPIAVAVDPLTRQPVVAWTERVVSGGVRVRWAERLAGDCPFGDCANGRWSGCSAPPVFQGSGRASLDVALDPQDGAPTVLIVYQQSGPCGSGRLPHIVVRRRDTEGTWVGETVASGTCDLALGHGAAVSVHPLTGATELFYTRASAAAGALMHASDATGSWVLSEVMLGDGVATDEGTFTRVDAAHRSDGALGVALTLQSPLGSDGFGYIARTPDGAWGEAEVVDVMGGGGIRPMEGLSLAFDGAARPHLGYTRNGVLRHARRDAAGWDVRFVDPDRDAGDWASLALDDAGAVWLAHQRGDDPRHIRFVSAADPHGASAVSGAACDDDDACTEDSCEPGVGCVHAAVACDDGDPCTVDRCGAQGCSHAADGCADGNPCTDDACIADVGCAHTPNTAACDDADQSTIHDVCDQGECAGLPAVLTLPTVVEVVGLSDSGVVLPTVVLPLVVETIGAWEVVDALEPPPTVVLNVSEAIMLRDDPTVVPPIVLTVDESIGVTDRVAAVPPLLLPLVTERVAVADAPDTEASEPEPEPEPTSEPSCGAAGTPASALWLALWLGGLATWRRRARAIVPS